MTRQWFAHTLGLLCIVLVVLMPVTQCAKEYSYEGGPLADTTATGDTTTGSGDTTSTPLLQIPSCSSCTAVAEVKPNSWVGMINGTVVCGSVTGAVKSIEGTAMTFFGPSACSSDTGLVITAYFVAPGLSGDKANLPAQSAAVEYYDNVTPSNIAAAFFTREFSLAIEHYTQQTGEATGTFSGRAQAANGEPVTITAGRFHIIFK